MDKDFATLDVAVKAINPAGQAKPAVAVVQTRLKDPDPVRRLAAYALSQIDREEAKQAVPALVEALRDNEPRVRAGWPWPWARLDRPPGRPSRPWANC